jgi:hypothetical protein
VIVLSPRELTGEEAVAMSEALGRTIDEEIDLTVRYEIGGTVAQPGEAGPDGTEAGE